MCVPVQILGRPCQQIGKLRILSGTAGEGVAVDLPSQTAAAVLAAAEQAEAMGISISKPMTLPLDARELMMGGRRGPPRGDNFGRRGGGGGGFRGQRGDRGGWGGGGGWDQDRRGGGRGGGGRRDDWGSRDGGNRRSGGWSDIDSWGSSDRRGGGGRGGGGRGGGRGGGGGGIRGIW